MSERVLLYINHIYLDEDSGQASFERNLTKSIAGKAAQNPEFQALFFSVSRPGEKADETAIDNSRLIKLPLNKKSLVSYLLLQWRLLWVLSREIFRHRKKTITIYTRYNASMLTPALISFLFRKRLVFRTGPTFASMNVYRPGSSYLMKAMVAVSIWLFCRQADAIIVITPKVADYFSNLFPFTKNKLKIVPNGTDVEKFSPLAPDRKRWSVPEDAFVIGYAGFIDRDQGLHTVIEAMGDLQRKHGSASYFLVLGDGPYKNDCVELAARLHVTENIIWQGKRNHDEVPSAIATCDIMVLPLTRHSMSVRGTSAMKLFEYLACDRFVLASKCEDLEFLEIERVGRLIEPEDTQAWARVIQDLMNENGQESKLEYKMNGRARKLAVKDYSFSRVADDILSSCFD